ncbi:hypothetical protein BGZ63DRAFT_84767 [Mariannaea sp. PMI_226]|nr:hypothetical protein BGZ63DRAFT_84767 [Mariannaea sp. PMI_226]
MHQGPALSLSLRVFLFLRNWVSRNACIIVCQYTFRDAMPFLTYLFTTLAIVQLHSSLPSGIYNQSTISPLSFAKIPRQMSLNGWASHLEEVDIVTCCTSRKRPYGIDSFYTISEDQTHGEITQLIQSKLER